MKKKIFILLLFVIILACKSDDEQVNDNPNLFMPVVNLNLNLNLPEYNPLKFPGSSVIINSQGIKGVVIYNVNNDLYTAFDLSDPNHVPSQCSKMTIEGIIATCPCTNDTNSYDIVTGLHTENETFYPMQQYRTERIGDIVRVYN
jgi:hypothetical protein